MSQDWNMGESKDLGDVPCLWGDEYNIDGCYFCASRLDSRKKHHHVTAHIRFKDRTDAENDYPQCVCEGHWRMVANQPNVISGNIRIYEIGND